MQDRASERGVPPKPLTELRIHGVGGATPEGLLGVPYTELVAGDKTAGFYRPPSWITIDGPERNLEGYSWGGITSRARIRALWVLLVPFAFVNLAGWMFPHGGSAASRSPRRRPVREAIDVGLIRILGIFTTGTVGALFSFIVIDIIGRRCSYDCLDPWYLAPWRWWANGVPSRLGLSIGLAGLLMLGIALLARISQGNLHSSRRGEVTSWRGKVTADPAFRVGLTSRQIWDSAHVAHRLGLLHTAFSLAVVGGLGAQLATGATDSGLVETLMLVQVAVAITAVIGVGWLGTVDKAWASLVLGVAVVAWLGTALATWTAGEPALDDASMLSGLTLVFGLAVLSVLAPWAASIWSSVFQPVRKMRARGLAAGQSDGEASMPVRIAVPFLGLGLAVAFGSGILIRVAVLLDVDYDKNLAGRVAVYSLGWMLTALLVGIWSWWRAEGAEPECVAGRYPNSTLSPSDQGWQKSVKKAERDARVTDQAATIIIVSTIAVVLAMAIGGYVSFAWIDAVAEPASWVLSFTPIVTVLLMQRLYNSADARKLFGIIWDVASFFPRWYHPWAPPSYGERAVPRLRRRLETLTEKGDVILSAHSQGTIIAAAALAPRLGDERRIALLTHGCPLDRLYARYFPEYFDDGLFDVFAESVGPEGEVPVWRNLWRHTDYIGGPVRKPSHELPDPNSDCDPPGPPVGSRFEDVWVPDPDRSEPVVPGDPRPKPLRHSNFFSTGAYRTAIDDLARTLGYGVE